MGQRCSEEVDYVPTEGPGTKCIAKKSPSTTHFNTEIPSVNVVPQEKVARGRWGAAHFEELHQVKELPVDVPTNWKAMQGK